MAKYVLAPLRWTARFPAPPGYCGLWTRGFNSSQGHLEIDKGFEIQRRIASNTDKAVGSWVHRTETGKEYVWFYFNDKLYKNDGATPSAIGSTLTTTNVFAPSTANMGAPADMTVFLNGADGDAHVVRENSGGTDIEAVKLEMAAPAQPTTSTATSGGSFADGTYQIRTCWLDDTGPVTVFTAPSPAKSQATSGGGASTVTVNEPGSAPSRATKFRVAFTAAGATDSPSNYLYWTDVAVGAGNQTFTALPAVQTSQAFTEINGTYRQATIPLDSDAGVVALHEGRAFYASTSRNEIAFSERDNPNHFYTTNKITSGAETGWTSPVTGMISAGGSLYVFTRTSIHRVTGSFRRDDTGSNPTYAVDVRTDVVSENYGCVNHASILERNGVIYFWSPTHGPSVLLGNTPAPLGQIDLWRFLECVDRTYEDRVVCAYDPDLNVICWLVPRKTNATRPQDGAATAGICDLWLRWDINGGFWCPPRELEATHLSTRTHPANPGDKTTRAYLCAVSPHGSVYRMNYGSAAGTLDTSGAAYNGLLASANTTTTATVALAGVSSDQLVGKPVTLYYPTTDGNFPGERVQVVVSTNTGTDGSGNVVLTWKKALTAPSATRWTVRVEGKLEQIDLPHDPFAHPMQAEPGEAVAPGDRMQLQRVDVLLRDTVGAEAIG